MKERGLDIYKMIATVHRKLNSPALLSSVTINKLFTLALAMSDVTLLIAKQDLEDKYKLADH